MPIFNFECSNCGSHFSEFIIGKEKLLCKCGGIAKKLFTMPEKLLTIFVGGGFHCTTYEQKRWNSKRKRYQEDVTQITEKDAAQINYGRGQVSENAFRSKSFEPIEGDLVKPSCSKMI